MTGSLMDPIAAMREAKEWYLAARFYATLFSRVWEARNSVTGKAVCRGIFNWVLHSACSLLLFGSLRFDVDSTTLAETSQASTLIFFPLLNQSTSLAPPAAHSRSAHSAQIEIRRRNDEVEKKTKEVDRLNKAYDKLTAAVVDENMGPLEATIANITKEIVAKSAEAKDLQRAWVTCQTELVGLINDNNGLAEKVQVGFLELLHRLLVTDTKMGSD